MTHNRTVRHGVVSFVVAAVVASAPSHADLYAVNVAGLGGEPDYEQRFAGLAADLDRLFKATGETTHTFTLAGTAATRAGVTQTLQAIAAQAKPDDELVVTLIGHGSFDGVQYKLNLVGPDLSAPALAQLCNGVAAKRQLIVNTTSASGGSIAALARNGRGVVVATKSGTEKNATIFARYWVQALQDPTADTDKNDSISALEAYTYATARTAAFYESQKRLATEHAVFADLGNSASVRAASVTTGAGRLLSGIVVLRLGSEQAASSDPARQAMLTRKEALERQIDTLKFQRAAMGPEEYKQQLTEALVALAKLQEEMDK